METILLPSHPHPHQPPTPGFRVSSALVRGWLPCSDRNQIKWTFIVSRVYRSVVKHSSRTFAPRGHGDPDASGWREGPNRFIYNSHFYDWQFAYRMNWLCHSVFFPVNTFLFSMESPFYVWIMTHFTFASLCWKTKIAFTCVNGEQMRWGDADSIWQEHASFSACLYKIDHQDEFV